MASLLGLISRTVFIYTLGADYLGLSGLLSNVLGFFWRLVNWGLQLQLGSVFISP